MTFTKLFNSITESTVWCEPDRVRIVWITMLAMADRKGRVWASVPGLAGRARVPIEDCVDALKRFQEPDPWSRTPAHEGRRIAPIAGGWILLNYEDYRNLRDEETIKESKRRYINERRARERAERVEKSSTVECGRPQSTEAEAEAEAEAVKDTSFHTPTGIAQRKAPRGTKKCPESFTVTTALQAWAAEHVPGIDLHRETSKLRDHTFSRAISDWDGAWRNWMRRASEGRPGVVTVQNPDVAAAKAINETKKYLAEMDSIKRDPERARAAIAAAREGVR